jgi:hypothetical protein
MSTLAAHQRYSAIRRRSPKTLLIGISTAVVLALPGTARAASSHAATPAPGGRIAAAGQTVAGLTLAQATAPSPLPRKLPVGHSYTPPTGKIFTGVADKPVSTYADAVGKHPAVYQEFVAWGQWLPTIADDAKTNHARSMMMVSTAFGSRNMITPAGIAHGAGDSWLIGLAQQVYASGNVTYLRLMAEMNNCNNPYAADNCDGSSRGAAYSAAAFKQAWRRVTLIMRGGPISLIDRQLNRLRMPRLATSLSYLPTPKVAMVWVPETGGSPDIAGLEPSVYWPGRRWVDWVGTDFYSRYPNFSGLSRFYSEFAGAPFTFGEYGIWDGDDPSWAKSLLGWIGSHRRTRMLVYNGASTFALNKFPASAGVLRGGLAGPRFLAYAPEWAAAT